MRISTTWVQKGVGAEEEHERQYGVRDQGAEAVQEQAPRKSVRASVVAWQAMSWPIAEPRRQAS